METSTSIAQESPGPERKIPRRQLVAVSFALVAVLALGFYLILSDVAITRWRAAPLAERYPLSGLTETFEELREARIDHDVDGLMALHDPKAVAIHQGRDPEEVIQRQRSHLKERPDLSDRWIDAQIISIRLDPEWTHNWGHEVFVVTCDNGKKAWFHRTEDGWRALVFEPWRSGRRRD